MSFNPLTVEYTVRPRKWATDTRAIIAVGRDLVAVERTGEVFYRSKLPDLLKREPSSLIVVDGASGLLKELDSALNHLASWQWRITPITTRKIKYGDECTPLEVCVNFLGFTRPNKKPGHYHYPLDPRAFTTGGIEDLLPDTAPDFRALMEWGQDVREWCQANGLKVTPRNGGLAAQLLKDKRFWPEARRKVPKATNERARSALPGNHYQLHAAECSAYRHATYLDMKAAHHHAAKDIQFPNPNTLYARGRFKTDPTEIDIRRDSVWCSIHSRKYKQLIRCHGLFLLRIAVAGKYRYPPPYAAKRGRRLAYVYSNELPLLRRLNIAIEGIESCWISDDVDPGLNRYAEWALAETDAMTEERRRWCKPTMLATYGMLAARPKVQEHGFRMANTDDERLYLTSRGVIRAHARVTKTPHEPITANVIARGMIEAQVRMDVLALADDLTSRGCRVLCVYADSLIVQGNLPLIPDPWRVKTGLTDLYLFNSTSFHSREMTRLPGLPHDCAARLSRIKSISAGYRATMKE